MRWSLRLFVWMAIFLFSASVVMAADVTEAIQSVQADMKRTLAVYEQESQRRSAERIELTTRLRQRQEEVAALRQQYRALHDVGWQGEGQLEDLRQRVNRLQQDEYRMTSALTEYRRGLTQRFPPIRQQPLEESLTAMDQLIHASEGSPLLAEAVMDLAQAVHPALWHGLVFDATIVRTDGTMLEGTAAAVGPLTYFYSGKEDAAGLIATPGDAAWPTVAYPVKGTRVQRLIEGEASVLPLDPTQGDAIKSARTRGPWYQQVLDGGVTMIPILGLALMCLGIVIYKALGLARLRTDVRFAIGRIIVLMNQGEFEEAKRLCRELGPPVAPVLLEGIRHRAAPKEHMEEIMHEQILMQIPLLEKGLPLLAAAAAAAPLLGLLGTVTGMMHTFDLVTVFGSGQADLLSSGINEALITTKYGLIVAIPALLVHAYFTRRVKLVIHTLDETMMSFINGLKIRTPAETERI